MRQAPLSPCTRYLPLTSCGRGRSRLPISIAPSIASDALPASGVDAIVTFTESASTLNEPLHPAAIADGAKANINGVAGVPDVVMFIRVNSEPDEISSRFSKSKRNFPVEVAKLTGLVIVHKS